MVYVIVVCNCTASKQVPETKMIVPELLLLWQLQIPHFVEYCLQRKSFPARGSNFRILKVDSAQQLITNYQMLPLSEQGIWLFQFTLINL